MGNDWLTPAVFVAVGQVLVQVLVAVATLIAIFQTKSEMKGVRRDVDGRFSQLLDLLARLSGVPERRGTERRANEDTDGRQRPADERAS